MDALLSAIRENPLSYLPEVSLVAFQHFRAGYLARSAMGVRLMIGNLIVKSFGIG